MNEICDCGENCPICEECGESLCECSCNMLDEESELLDYNEDEDY